MPCRSRGGVADDTLLSAFDVNRIEPEALLFQTGYLTIVRARSGTRTDPSIRSAIRTTR